MFMDDCIFCKIVKGDIPCKKVYEDEHTFAFLDIEPATNGHTLIIPKKHFSDIYDMPLEELTNIMNAAKKIVKKYEEVGVKAINLVQSNRKPAQQDVFHFHLHLLPRADGDGVDIWGKTHKRGEKIDSNSFFEMLK